MSRIVPVAVVAFLLPAAPAPAAVRNWDGPLHNGHWSVAANWSGDVLPTAGDTVYLGGADEGRDITLDGVSPTVARIYGGARLTIDGVLLTVTGGPDLTSFSDARVTDGGAIAITGAGPAQGVIALDDTSALTFSGTGIKFNGTVSGTGAVKNTGEVAIPSASSFVARFENDGLLSADAPTEIVALPGAGASDGRFAIATNLHFRPRTGATVTLGAGASVTGAGTFEATDFGTLRVERGATFTPGTLATGDSLRLELEADAQVGAAELRENTAAGGRYGAGELKVAGASLLRGAVLGGGSTIFDGPLRITTATSRVTARLRSNGAVMWDAGGMDVPGTWENAGALTLSGNTGLTGTLTNSGAISAAGTNLGAGNVVNSGTVTITGRLGSGGTYTQSAGTTNVMAGATLDKDVVLDGGVLKGRGTVRSLVNNGGTVEPGASPGTLSVSGAFAQGAAGILRAEIEPSAYDVLAVGGAATLGGTLEIVTTTAPVPLKLLTAASINGQWAKLVAPAGYGVSYQADGFTTCACAAPVTPTPTPVPVATVAPETPSPPPPPPAPAAKPLATISFPASCRGFKLRLRGPVKTAAITVNGHKAKTVRGAGTFKLKLPRGRVTVKVVVKQTDGRTVTRSVRYRSCSAR